MKIIFISRLNLLKLGAFKEIQRLKVFYSQHIKVNSFIGTAMDTKLILLVVIGFAAVVFVEGLPKPSEPPKKPPMTKKAPCKPTDTPDQCTAKVKKLQDNQDQKYLEQFNEWIQEMSPADKATWKTVHPTDAKTYDALIKKFG